ncbi:uncharacterized protein LOC120328501 [Styela clava]
MFKSKSTLRYSFSNITSNKNSQNPVDIFLPNYVTCAKKKENPMGEPTTAQYHEVHESLKIRPLLVVPYQFGQDASMFIDIIEASISLNGLIKNDPQKAIAVCQYMDPAVVVAIRRLIAREDYYNTNAIFGALLKLFPAGINDGCPVLQSFRKQRIGEPYAEYGEHLIRYARNCAKPGQLTDIAMVRAFTRGLLNEEAKCLLQYQAVPPKNLAECYEQLQRSTAVFPHFGVLGPLRTHNKRTDASYTKGTSMDGCKYCKTRGHVVENCRKLKNRLLASEN